MYNNNKGLYLNYYDPERQIGFGVSSVTDNNHCVVGASLRAGRVHKNAASTEYKKNSKI